MAKSLELIGEIFGKLTVIGSSLAKMERLIGYVSVNVVKLLKSKELI